MLFRPISSCDSAGSPFVPVGLRGAPAIERAVTGDGAGSGWRRALLAALGTGVCTIEDLLDFGLDFGGPPAAAILLNQLEEWHARGLLSFVFRSRGAVVAECFGDFIGTPYIDLGAEFRFSPHVFAQPCREKGGGVIRTAAGSHEVLVTPPVLARLLDARFSTDPWIAKDGVTWLTESSAELTEHAAHGLLSLLVRAGAVDVERSNEGDRAGALRMWEFHDLLFHARSTRGRSSSGRQGATFRFRGITEPAPARRVTSWPMYRMLPRAEPSDLRLPLWEAIHQRRSPPAELTVASHVTVNDLGRFLSTLAILPGTSAGLYETTRRLYPGAGACYELEFYLVLANCEGASRGVFYYDPEQHALCQVSEWNPTAELIEKRACEATGRIMSAACIVLISARFARLAWKYEGISYSLCLKDVGVVFEHMYLTAAALRLEVCALGSADADLFHDITGNDLLLEPLVGQFMIVGRRRDA